MATGSLDPEPWEIELVSDSIILWPSAMFSSATTKQSSASNVETASWANVAVQLGSAFWAVVVI